MSETLLIADKMSLELPVLSPLERRLLTNPIRFLSDLYLTRSRRKGLPILQDIDIELRPGDRLGVLGHNGAGKSTLLRTLAGIYVPSGGSLIVNGRARGLFDVSLGMMPQATGLENIYLRGLQMGMTLAQVKGHLPEVTEFTELGDDLHRLFGTYSTGMRLRLAFAISTMIEPDILLMDEWLGAGDARFKDKARERMDDLVSKSRALVLASHGMGLLRQNCNKGLVLDQGRVVYTGGLDGAIELYEKMQRGELAGL